MATAKANRKMAATAVELPECPVCLDTMSAPIFQCQSGHSLCSTCTNSLMPPMCPICRQPMTQMRNWQLEDIISKSKAPCPNKPAGCVYVMVAAEVDDHLKECIFRMMHCPLGAVFGRCSWNGKLSEMMDHFKERHPAHSSISSDSDVELTNVSVKDDDRHVFLVAQVKLLFIVTMKIDTLKKMAYWTIQHIGSKKVAQQHIYEIHVTSKQDSRRKAVFIEHCFNDAITADEVFNLGKCAVLPLDVLNHFVKDRKLSFRFFIKRIPFIPKGKAGEKEEGKNENKPPNKGPKGPANFKGPTVPNNPNFRPGSSAGFKGSFNNAGAGPRGPGPKKFK